MLWLHPGLLLIIQHLNTIAKHPSLCQRQMSSIRPMSSGNFYLWTNWSKY